MFTIVTAAAAASVAIFYTGTLHVFPASGDAVTQRAFAINTTVLDATSYVVDVFNCSGSADVRRYSVRGSHRTVRPNVTHLSERYCDVHTRAHAGGFDGTSVQYDDRGDGTAMTVAVQGYLDAPRWRVAHNGVQRSCSSAAGDADRWFNVFDAATGTAVRSEWLDATRASQRHFSAFVAAHCGKQTPLDTPLRC
mmetsp:Transcript_22200/g.54233  ORF Transcript_22200/g.54233 Transcript_22200/m.54233 type:complete len:194 (+) Transcript_22200:81-662(+)